MNISSLKPSELEFFARWTIQSKHDNITDSMIYSFYLGDLCVFSEFFHSDNGDSLSIFIEFAKELFHDPELFTHVHRLLSPLDFQLLLKFG